MEACRYSGGTSRCRILNGLSELSPRSGCVAPAPGEPSTRPTRTATQAVFTIRPKFVSQLVPGQVRIRRLTDGTTFSLTPFDSSLRRPSPCSLKGRCGRLGLVPGVAAVMVGLRTHIAG